MTARLTAALAAQQAFDHEVRLRLAQRGVQPWEPYGMSQKEKTEAVRLAMEVSAAELEDAGITPCDCDYCQCYGPGHCQIEGHDAQDGADI